tara:strand:+ start:123 stop:737 length:615 start_codon:yes stop_codon:yes gene_type:complete
MSDESLVDDIAWVDVIYQKDATDNLKLAYEAVKGKDGTVENLYLAMSQTPEVIKPAEDHYVAVLHNPNSPLKPWFAELVSTYVAILCGCKYAYLNHGENFEYYFGNRKRSKAILSSLHEGSWEAELVSEYKNIVPALKFSKKLTLSPDNMTKDDIDNLRAVGFDDKEISYIVQIVSSFAYWSRMINALGTKIGKTIGFANTKGV